MQLLLACNEELVGNSGFGEHALYVAGEELQSLAASALRVHEYHDAAGPPDFCVRDTWNKQTEEKVITEEDKQGQPEQGRVRDSDSIQSVKLHVNVRRCFL